MSRLKLFRVNTMSPTFKGNIMKVGDIIRGHKIIGFTNNKNNPVPENVTRSKAIYGIGQPIKGKATE